MKKSTKKTIIVSGLPTKKGVYVYMYNKKNNKN